jgi:hypothetical protein
LEDEVGAMKLAECSFYNHRAMSTDVSRVERSFRHRVA